MLWPNNKRLALMLSFDIDAETLWLTRNEINKNHPANLSRGLYSVKQGIPRIVRMLEEENVSYRQDDNIQSILGCNLSVSVSS